MSPHSEQLIEVDAVGRVPRTVRRLNQWEYIERAVHRILAGWGNQAPDWESKQALSRHVWDQAEIVQALRERTNQFPGGKAGGGAHPACEALVDTVLDAPCFEDLLDGLHQCLGLAQVRSYLHYLEHGHPVHDAPTMRLLSDLMTRKDEQRKWLREYRRRHPHTISPDYAHRIHGALAQTGDLLEPLESADPHEHAGPVGLRSGWQPHTPYIPPQWLTRLDISPFISADFETSVETRRLFWIYAYMRELNLAQDQLLWLWSAHYMPWDFHYDESRHQWDEARHGDSGYSRMLDFGLTIEEIGFTYPAEVKFEGRIHPQPQPFTAMTAAQLYDALFFIGMVAETGHFRVKHEAFEDFRNCGDLASAEMMLFDIIDETAHVQYARRWLPVIAEKAGLSHEGFEKRALAERDARQQVESMAISSGRSRTRTAADPAYALYANLLGRLRERCPLQNTHSVPPRTPKPM